MKAWRVTELGEPCGALRLEDLEDPRPGPGQVLVRVRAAALNFPDVLLCRGTYQVKPPLPFTPGVELCGEVAALGGEVTGVTVGARVIGSPASGAFAELALMPVAGLLPAPDSLTDAQAAAFHLGYQTGWFALHRRAGLQPGETLLVHAAAGGVGSAAVQLGKAAGARVIGVVGGPAKVKIAHRLGADIVVDRYSADFVPVVKEATGGRGADVIYNPVDGHTYLRSTKCVAFEGRILVIGFAGGQIASVPLNHALVKNYSVVGLNWGLYRTVDPGLVRRRHDELSEMAAAGAVAPLVTERVGMNALPGALQRLADGTTAGRAVLLP